VIPRPRTSLFICESVYEFIYDRRNDSYRGLERQMLSSVLILKGAEGKEVGQFVKLSHCVAAINIQRPLFVTT
jgi:hypothetical protein